MSWVFRGRHARRCGARDDRARRAAVGNAVSPPQFSPFGNPHSRFASLRAPRRRGVIPPFFGGSHQRGKPAGGNRAAALVARTAAGSLFFSRPFALRCPSAPRRPPGSPPPLRRFPSPDPRPGGRVGPLPAQPVSAFVWKLRRTRAGLRTAPALRGLRPADVAAVVGENAFRLAALAAQRLRRRKYRGPARGGQPVLATRMSTTSRILRWRLRGSRETASNVLRARPTGPLRFALFSSRNKSATSMPRTCASFRI